MPFKTANKILEDLIECYEFEDAVFLAEQLISEGDGSAKTYYLLARAYDHLGKAEKALLILKSLETPSHESNFLYLKILIQTRKFAQVDLFVFDEKPSISIEDIKTNIQEKFGKYYSSVLKLVGKSKKIIGDLDQAKKFYSLSFESNPFLWSSYEYLCHIRFPPDINSVLVWPQSIDDSLSFSNESIATPERSLKANSDSSVRLSSGLDNSSYDLRQVRATLKSTPLTVKINRRKFPASESKISKKSKGISLNQDNSNTATQKVSLNSSILVKTDIETRILRFFNEVGILMQHCEKYDYASAESCYKNILKNHKDSCYVKSLMAALYYNLQNFEQSQKLFDSVRAVDPYWTKHMDICSSNLWQLNDVTKLEAIVNFLTCNSPMQFETWICAGNLSSLNKKPQKAISYFKRAKFLDSLNPYSYTLIAQEMAILENQTIAENQLKNVIILDPMHYQAWYSLGRLKSEQQQYTDAIKYLQYSSNINPYNTVILSLFSYCLLKDNKHIAALDVLTRALQLEPNNVLLKYEKASILYESGMLKDSLSIINSLINSCRYDSAVLLLAAKIYFQMEEYREATECATRVTSQGKYNSTAEAEAKELLKKIGLFQNNINSKINTKADDTLRKTANKLLSI